MQSKRIQYWKHRCYKTRAGKELIQQITAVLKFLSGNNKHFPLYIAFYVLKIVKISQCCLDTGFVPCLNV